MREPTIFDAEKGLARAQHSIDGGPWVDGCPSRAGMYGVNVRLRYVWLEVPEEPARATLDGKCPTT